jgi:dephospho-CoA kinase
MASEIHSGNGDGTARAELAVGHSPMPAPQAPLVVGLIGGIGSGKSQVAAAFAERGARVVAGDDLAHDALRQPEIKAQIERRWGKGVLDERGEVQRSRLGAIVFAEPTELRALEAIVHPWIRERIARDVKQARKDPAVRLVVLDAAIMLEAGWNEICDRLVFIDAPAEVRRRRVAGQRGWNLKDLESRERAQLPLTAKAARADHTLDNSGSLDRLGRQVDELLRLWGLTPEVTAPRSGTTGTVEK